MDYYQTSTKILDSWDFKNFPLARPRRDQNREKSVDDNNSACVEKNVRRRLARRKESFWHKKKVDSSTSLILKKTDKQVFNDHSVLSFTNILHSVGRVYGDVGAAKQPSTTTKPVIQVTVKKQTNTKINTKKVKTTKNPENINEKYVYLVVAGRKKEKIYELNAIAAQYSEGKNDSAIECADIKESLKINLNSCKKSIKQKKNIEADDGLLELKTDKVDQIKMFKKSNVAQSTKKKMVDDEAGVSNPVKESSNSKREAQRITVKTSPQLSVHGENRIRITGRVGLNKDDKYVLKCDATLDDEPIQTFPANEDLMLCLNRGANRQTSQATQVNLEIFYPQKYNSTKIFANHDKIVQCYCASNAENARVSDERGDIALKECSSPIVIISVYPQPESTDKVTKTCNVTKDIQVTRPRYAPSNERNANKINKNQANNEDTKNKTKSPRSRSPSPVRNIGKENEKTKREVKETNQRTQVNRKQLGGTTIPTVKTTNTKSTKMQNTSQVNSITNKKTEGPKSPVSPRSPARKAPKKKTDNTTGTNTELMLTKKALVENFTKSYTARLDAKDRKDGHGRASTKNDVSNVTINIEGGNDFYNVMFHQTARDTDVTVRKTPKGVCNFVRDNEATSLENFLLSENDANHPHTSFSQTFRSDTQDISTQPHQPTSRLNIRDSIQVSRWREEKHSHDDSPHSNFASNRKEVNNAVLAPMKHYRGDDCSICDPNERDREIRELLGIDRNRVKPPSREASSVFGPRSRASLTCFHRDNSASVCRDKNEHVITTSIQHTPLYNQLILNQNIKVLFQINQSNKQPIVLSRQQYAKVKRSLYCVFKNNNLNRRRRSSNIEKRSVSIDNVKRRKTKENATFHYNKGTQTDLIKALAYNTGTMYVDETLHYRKRTPTCEPASKIGLDHRLKSSSIHKSCNKKRSSFSNDFSSSIGLNKQHHIKQHEVTILYEASYNTGQKMFKEESSRRSRYPMKSASSVEAQYMEMSYSKQVKFSPSDLQYHALNHVTSDLMKPSISQNIEQKRSQSIQTIFKGKRRCHTPNLGTSAYSLCPESPASFGDHSHFKGINPPVNYELKPKKPFLRRLISCLAMRVSEKSAAKLPVEQCQRYPHGPNSFDSYHINTSLGGIDMTSSLFDTSISFFSNHTIKPVSRMKRGVISYVRGFLGSHRSHTVR